MIYRDTDDDYAYWPQLRVAHGPMPTAGDNAANAARKKTRKDRRKGHAYRVLKGTMASRRHKRAPA